MSVFFFFSSRRRHTRCSRDWSSDVCSSDLKRPAAMAVQSGYVDNSETGWRSPSFAYPSFEEFRAQNHAFASIFGFTPLSHATVNIDGQAGLGGGELVTGDYFSGLGVSPILGRTINDEDAKASSPRSEEHTSELQSRLHLVCRLLLEKKKSPESLPTEWIISES